MFRNGWGFIRLEGVGRPDAFYHIKSFRHRPLVDPQEGDGVIFDLVEQADGRTRAEQLEFVD
jgi:cold shock CspA family protein